jgi:hypothetical protein
MQVLTNTTNESIDSNIDFNSPPPIRKYFYCKDKHINPSFHDTLIYVRKIELINNCFPKEETTHIKPYLFNLNILNHNLENPELLIEVIANKVKNNINFSDIPVNFGISLLGMAVYNFISMSMKGNHKKGEYIEQDHNQLISLFFNGVLLTSIHMSINLIYEKVKALYTYGYAIKSTIANDSYNLLLNVIDNKNFISKYPFKHIDIIKLIYIIKEELNYNYNETTELYKIICLSIMELWIEDNLLIENDTDTITKLAQKSITLIIKNNWLREALLFNKEIAISLKQAVNYIKNENNQIKIELLQKSTIEQQDTLTAFKPGFYTVLGSNLLLYIKKSFLGDVTYKIYHPILQLEVSTKNKGAVNELFNSMANENIFKQIMKD